MNNRKRAYILGCYVDLLTAQEGMEQIKKFIDMSVNAHIITLNAEIVYQAQSNQELKDIINKADLVTPDGIGIVWGGRQLGYDIRERVTGIDLLINICQEAPRQGWKIYLIGSAPGVAGEAAKKLEIDYPGLQICGTHHGYFNEDEVSSIIEEIKELAPDVLVVALGAPKQEIWINNYRERLGVTACIGVGGSLDVIAGQKKRAPKWMIRLNSEWLYRLLTEPSRIQRQVVLPKFIGLILKNKWQARH